MISKDGGNIWKSFGFKGERILNVKLNPRDPSILYLLTIRGSYKVEIKNYAISKIERLWKNITNNLDLPFTVWSLSVSPHDGTVYVGSSHGTWKLPPPY